MNKKEILEIRKQFTPENCTISRICGCYVDGEKHIVMEHKDAFGSLSEEEAFKYFDIFRHTLSGTPGKISWIWNFLWKRKRPAAPRIFCCACGTVIWKTTFAGGVLSEGDRILQL